MPATEVPLGDVDAPNPTSLGCQCGREHLGEDRGAEAGGGIPPGQTLPPLAQRIPLPADLVGAHRDVGEHVGIAVPGITTPCWP